MKEKLEKLKSEIDELRASVGKHDNVKPLNRVLLHAAEFINHAIHEAVSLEDPIENRTRYGTPDLCVCPHCGKLNKIVFDDVYYEGEKYDITCDHCQACWAVHVDSVVATVSVGLEALETDGYCRTCFHWEHAPGECAPYKYDCECEAGDE